MPEGMRGIAALAGLAWAAGCAPSGAGPTARIDDTVVQLDGVWRFHEGGGVELAAAEVDDSTWREVRVPGTIPAPGWWRRRVDIPRGGRFGPSVRELIT